MNQIVLMYHDIYRDSPTESGFQNPTAIKYKVSAHKFEQQVASIDEYLRNNKLPVDAIDFTFDDGGVSSLTLAAPILERYGFRGKFYISTGYIGSKGFLDAEQIKELKGRGHEVGSHSHSHPERMNAMSQKNINDEWKFSQMVLAEILGHSPTYASIPNGYSSKSVLNGITASGIKVIDTSATTTKQSQFKNASIRGRYAITDDMSVDMVMQIIESPSFRLRKAFRWHLLSIAKALLGNSYIKIRSLLSS